MVFKRIKQALLFAGMLASGWAAETNSSSKTYEEIRQEILTEERVVYTSPNIDSAADHESCTVH